MKYIYTTPIFIKIILKSGILAILIFLGIEYEQPTDDVKVVAHRGGNIERPENTMAAFKRAVKISSDILEIDLRTSRDGKIFILHDETLDRTTNKSGPAKNLTLDELRQLDAGSWFGPSYVNEQIPSFKEVLQWATEKQITLLLDLKESSRKYAERVAHEATKFGDVKSLVIGVRSTRQAQEFSELLPDARQLAFMSSPSDIEAYTETKVAVIRLWLRWLEQNPNLAEQVHQSGKKLMINGTTGNLQETKTIMSYNPDWILTDHPAQLQRSLKELY